MKISIKVTICPEKALWVGIFERLDDKGLAAARVLFYKEPTDPELYEWVSLNFLKLQFSAPQQFKLIIKRKNPKRVLRDIKKELAKGLSSRKESFAQETLRVELEKHKKLKKTNTKIDKEAKEAEKFAIKQDKKKQKQRGH